MLAQHLWHCDYANISPALGQHFVFAGMLYEDTSMEGANIMISRDRGHISMLSYSFFFPTKTLTEIWAEAKLKIIADHKIYLVQIFSFL